MINDVEHLSTYLLVICVSSLEKMSIQVSIFNFLLSCIISFVFWISIPSWIFHLQIFFPLNRVIFPFVGGFLFYAKVFRFM